MAARPPHVQRRRDPEIRQLLQVPFLQEVNVGIDESGKQGGAAGVDDPRACRVVAHDAALDDNSGGPAKFTSIEHAHVGQRDLFAASRPGAVEQIRHLSSFDRWCTLLRRAVASMTSRHARGVESRTAGQLRRASDEPDRDRYLGMYDRMVTD
jgi:hypothetical protein